MAVRRELHRLGLRYRVDLAPIPGLRRRADVVFTRARVVLFVDGCYWHGCRLHGTTPKSNTEWWSAKIEANRRRDADTDAKLNAAGWTSVRAWEHEDPVEIADRVCALVFQRRR